MRNESKDREVKFERQAVKQNVNFHAGPKFRTDRPSSLQQKGGSAGALQQQGRAVTAAKSRMRLQLLHGSPAAVAQRPGCGRNAQHATAAA
jgi:hypothetical protein